MKHEESITITGDCSLTDLTVLWKAFATDLLRPYYWTDWTPMDFASFHRFVHHSMAWYAYTGKVIVGLGLLEGLKHGAGGHPLRGEVSLFVMPEWRKRSGRIWRAMAQVMLGTGVRYLYATIHAKHARCQRLAAAVGFVRTGYLPGYAVLDGKPQDHLLYVMERNDGTRT